MNHRKQTLEVEEIQRNDHTDALSPGDHLDPQLVTVNQTCIKYYVASVCQYERQQLKNKCADGNRTGDHHFLASRENCSISRIENFTHYIMSMLTAPEIIKQLNEAKNLAFSSRETFPQVLRQILNFVSNPEPSIKLWCATFLRDSFQSDDSVLGNADKIDLAIDSLDALISLSNEPQLEVFDHVIDTSVVVFKLVFKYVNDNDGCDGVWQKLNELKTGLISKFPTTFPLESSDNEEHDLYRNLLSKVQLIKFIVLVIDYQTKSDSNIEPFNLLFVHSNHTLLKKNTLQAEAVGLLDNLLGIFRLEILVTPVINALLFQLTLLVKRKSQFVPRILLVVEKFDTRDKLQSNFQTLEEFKLSRKYVDRLVRIFVGHMFKYQLVPPNLQQSLNQKLTILTERGDDIRRKNIVAPSPLDANIKKKKFDGFVNASKKVTSLDYKNLYCLTDPQDELNSFDLASLPAHTLVSMTIAALNRVDPKKLNKALDIIAERYKYAIAEAGNLQSRKRRLDAEDDGPRRKMKYDENDDGLEDDDDNEMGAFDTATVYHLPPPKELSFQDKKDQINLIIQNFFKVSQMTNKEMEEAAKVDSNKSTEVNQELTKVAIQNWQKDSWLVILTRLATRGMSSYYGEGSVDEERNNELSDMVRNAIFDYFLENIHSRIDVIIEWLNEEWYSEVVAGEAKAKQQIIQSVTKEKPDNMNEEIARQTNEINQHELPTPIYNKWAGKVLDSIIPFLESTDKKIFIRLLSDLPLLTNELVSRIKSLCLDPARKDLGFLALQYLIMFRPPVKQGCLDVLTELSNGDQADLKGKASDLLKKYST